MIRRVYLNRLGQMTCDRGLYQKGDKRREPVDAADEDGRLSVLILHVGLDSAPDQKLHHVLSVTAAGDMKGCRQLSVYQVWLGPGAL